MKDEAQDGSPDSHQRSPEATESSRLSPEPVWQPVSSDPVLSRPPTAGPPGNIPAGEDLRLDIGWERFEQLMVFVAAGVLGLNQMRFRRYGVAGQAQHGIDLAGREADGAYTVVQCKEYRTFSTADLRAAVEKFTDGKRPFDARHLVIAVSSVTRTTQLEDELAALQDEHRDLRIELWGAEQINDVLRERADIVSRFWTRETAETFCTGAPLPGVPAAPPNWIRVADQVLLSPLGVDGLQEQLAHADGLRARDPAAAAAEYRMLADTLAADGFVGHANVLRHKLLDALAEAGELDAVAALTADLAATALHEADMHQARRLAHRLDALARGQHPNSTHAPDADGEVEKVSTSRHAELVRAAVSAAEHPLGDTTALLRALRGLPPEAEAPAYLPLLVLLLAELTTAEATAASTEPRSADQDGALVRAADPLAVRLAELDDLLTSALRQLSGAAPATADNDVTVRLRMMRAHFADEGRRTLLAQARQRRLPRAHAALILATQARRDALDGSAEEAIEHWRQAVEHAIHDGRTDAASGWLYAIRAVNARYGPWTDRIDEEHLLAQALPKTGSGRLIRRVRDPETDARRAALDHRPLDAIRAARRWLADSIVIGDWVDEQAAADLLGDLYQANAEPERAAACYEWAGETKKLTQLAAAVGDRLLPTTPPGAGPWWQQATSLAAVSRQHDLLDDDTAASLLATLIDLVARGRAGELTDNPTHVLTLQATKTACVLAGRGSNYDARALLDLLAADVARDENHYQPHDTEHVRACQSIALHHPDLAPAALQRIFDLAEVGADDALHALQDRLVIQLLEQPPAPPEAPSETSDAAQVLTDSQRQHFRDRLTAMAAAGRYEAGLAVAKLGGIDEAVTERARQAMDRLLNRPEPDGYSVSFGTRMVPDSFLITFLGLPDQHACLEKTLTIAADHREAASNRQDALTAAGNLLLDQPDDVKTDVHARSRAFVDGDQDGSHLDGTTTNPHPLSAMKIDFGSASLRAGGLRLSQCSAVSREDKLWVRDRAAALLGSDDQHTVRTAALTLSRLGTDVTADLDANLLAGHPQPVVRQLAAVLAAASPTQYRETLKALATDPESSVRTLLAHQLHNTQEQRASPARPPDNVHGSDEDPARETDETIIEVLGVLGEDIRHSVRRAVSGLDT